MFLDLDEAAYERQVLEWLKGIGWSHSFGPEIAPNGSSPERSNFKDVVLVERLEQALTRLNPTINRDVELVSEFNRLVKLTHSGQTA